MKRTSGLPHLSGKSRKHNPKTTTAVLKAIDSILRSRAFRQTVAALSPFVPVILRAIMRHYGWQ